MSKRKVRQYRLTVSITVDDSGNRTWVTKLLLKLYQVLGNFVYNESGIHAHSMSMDDYNGMTAYELTEITE